MPIYVVTYDLIAKKGEVRDYQPVWDALDNYPNFQVLYSVFLVDAPSDAHVEAALEPSLRKTDRYLIDRFRKGERRYRAMKGINDWLAAHPPG